MKYLICLLFLFISLTSQAEVITIKADPLQSGNLNEVIVSKSKIILTEKRTGYSEPYEILVLSENGVTVLRVPVTSTEYERIKKLMLSDEK